MTAERIRRVLARICSEATLTRIVDPILADMRWERDRPSWLGYLALLKALAVHSTLSIPDALGRAWRDDEHAVPRIAGLVLASALVAAVALTALPLTFGPFPMKSVPLVRLVVLLLPQALVLTLPAALLLAVPVALRNHALTRTLARRTVAVSICCVAATLVVMLWMPEANQSYRVLASGNASLPRGPNEWGFVTLREQIDVLNLTSEDRMTPEARNMSRRLEYAYHVRVALISAPIALGLLALGVTGSPAGRRRPVVAGVVALVLYLPWLFEISEATTASLERFPSVPPQVYAWTPMLVIAAVGLWLIARHPPADAGPPITETR
jgi:hypothetical protein